MDTKKKMEGKSFGQFMTCDGCGSPNYSLWRQEDDECLCDRCVFEKLFNKNITLDEVAYIVEGGEVAIKEADDRGAMAYYRELSKALDVKFYSHPSGFCDMEDVE